ncbi:hypothetical protein C8F01DRAFT_1243667 [Mycena amicta]|nr:hypothetical protein C8F01DRAFT_1243667 [Mycena amicta]
MTNTTMPQNLTMDVDLCELLRALEIAKPESARPDVLDDGDCAMAEAPVRQTRNQLQLTLTKHDDQSRPNSPSFQGCELLKSIQSQLDTFPTTGGAPYIEAILTHRQIFFAFPGGHRCCARAFSDLACSLQRREWRADRDSDMEAATAFNYEAQFIASIVS